MIVERHYDDETLIGLLFGGADSGADRDPHLASCSSCAESLESYRAVAEVLGEEAVWDLRQLTSGPDPNTIAALRNFSRSVSDEAADAGPLVDALLELPRTAWCETVRRDLRYRTAGVARTLSERSESVLDKGPLDAVEMARAAIALCDVIREDDYERDVVRKIRGAALRQQAYGLLLLGEIDLGLQSTAEARRVLEACAVSEYDLGRIGVIEAVLLSEKGLFSQARETAVRSARIFRAWGDRARLAAALNAEANVIVEQGRYEEALPLLVDIEASYRADMSNSSRARTIGNIALCYSQTGRIADALQNYLVAATIHDEEGTRTEAARIRFNIADLLASEGRFAEAKTRLNRVRSEFQQLGMDFLLVHSGLTLAEVHLAEGNAEEAERLCREALDQFKRTGVAAANSGVLALTFLQEALAQKRATPQTIRHVRKHFERVSHEPQLVFAPPPLPPA